jgi:putative ABC transport system ATP-binding protein
LFRRLAKRENRALLIVTHDPKVRVIADRVVRIHDGIIAD